MKHFFTDIHIHLIYGIDDGAATREDMEKMLDTAWAEEIRRIIVTPHVTPGVSAFKEEPFRRHLEEARQYCASKRYAIQIEPGAEILYTPMLLNYISEHALPTLGSTDRILVEFLPDVAYAELASALESLTRRGYSVILAHVERYRCLYGRNAYRLKEQFRVQYQMNGSTALQAKGIIQSYWARRWLKDKLIDYVATDAHGTRSRPVSMRAAYGHLKRQYGEAYALRLTTGFPD